MFIGHFAVALAAKKAAPKTSLGMLLAAATLLDLVWPVFLLLGWEVVRIELGNTAFTPLDFVSYPWTHSLLAALGWAAMFSLLYWRATRYNAGTIAVGLLVVSYWLLDAIVHRPDLPLYPGSETFIGLGLWNSIPATLAVEITLFCGGLGLYISTTRPVNKTGGHLFWAFVGVTVLMYGGAAFGTPPPSATVVAWVGMAAFAFPLWAWWFDRHRTGTGLR